MTELWQKTCRLHVDAFDTPLVVYRDVLKRNVEHRDLASRRSGKNKGKS